MEVTYHWGPLLPHIEVVNVYLNVTFSSPKSIPLLKWNGHDSDSNLQDLANRLSGFTQDLITSAHLAGELVELYQARSDSEETDLAP